MIAHHDNIKASHLNAREAQRQRREDALERQRASRTALFDLQRPSLDDELEDLEIEPDNDEMPDERPAVQPAPTPRLDKVQRKRLKWQKRYADKLMFAETLDPTQPSLGLPHDLESEWMAMPVPKGKRCLALTLGTDSSHANTLLLSRSQGRPLARRFTSLPAHTILDCVWDASQSILFILDILEWHSLPLSGLSTEVRSFWRGAKLAEMAPQPLFEGQAKERWLWVAPVPVYQSPSTGLRQALQQRRQESDITILRLPASDTQAMQQDGSVIPTSEGRTITYDIDGVLLLCKSALYESGLTCLAGWLPIEGGNLASAIALLDDETNTLMTS